MLTSSELSLWQLVTARFRLGTHTDHGPRHWRTVLRNGFYLGRVGITPDPVLLSTSTARDIATRFAWYELESIVMPDCRLDMHAKP